MWDLKNPNVDEQEKQKQVKPEFDGVSQGLAWKTFREPKRKDIVQAWDSIYSAHKQGFIMGAGSRLDFGNGEHEKDEAGADEETGMVPGHAYLLIGAYEL